jgi:protein TonB
MESGIVSEPASMGVGKLDGLFDEIGAGVVSIEPPPPIAPARGEPIRPGGDIRPPVRIRNVVPVYPTLAKRSRVQGVVVIEAIIGADGKVDNARVIRSIPLLDDAALKAVRSWEYTPTLLNGQPTPVIMTVTVQFTLN